LIVAGKKSIIERMSKKFELQSEFKPAGDSITSFASEGQASLIILYI